MALFGGIINSSIHNRHVTSLRAWDDLQGHRKHQRRQWVHVAIKRRMGGSLFASLTAQTPTWKLYKGCVTSVQRVEEFCNDSEGVIWCGETGGCLGWQGPKTLYHMHIIKSKGFITYSWKTNDIFPVFTNNEWWQNYMKKWIPSWGNRFSCHTIVIYTV